jgi:hypothetical protein
MLAIDLFVFGHNIKVERLTGAVVIREAQIARCSTLRLSNYLEHGAMAGLRSHSLYTTLVQYAQGPLQVLFK